MGPEDSYPVVTRGVSGLRRTASSLHHRRPVVIIIAARRCRCVEGEQMHLCFFGGREIATAASSYREGAALLRLGLTWLRPPGVAGICAELAPPSLFPLT